MENAEISGYQPIGEMFPYGNQTNSIALAINKSISLPLKKSFLHIKMPPLIFRNECKGKLQKIRLKQKLTHREIRKSSPVSPAFSGNPHKTVLSDSRMRTDSRKRDLVSKPHGFPCSNQQLVRK